MLEKKLKDWREKADKGGMPMGHWLFAKSIPYVAIGGSVLAGAWLFVLYNHNEEIESKIKANLAPNGIYHRDTRVDIENLDVNGDGAFEYILKIKNPITGDNENQIIELDGKRIRIQPYKVVIKKIEYLDQQCQQ